MAPRKKKKPAASTAVVARHENLPAVMSFENDEGGGMENVDGDSVAIPYIKLLQKMSPEVDDEDDKRIPEAKIGMFYHTITEKLYDNLVIIPCHFDRVFNEWVERDAGGGFKGRHTVAEALAIPTKRDGAKNWIVGGESTYLMDTRNHYVLLVDLETLEADPVIISLASTQLSVSRKWMSQQNMIKLARKNGKGNFTPPIYAHMWDVGTSNEERGKDKWKGWTFTMKGMLEAEHAALYEKAKKFHGLIAEGKARAADPGEVVEDDDDPDM